MPSTCEERTFGSIANLLAVAITLVVSSASVAQELNWPHEIDVAEGKITIYQPQIDEFEGQTIKGRSAVAVTLKGKTEPVFGAIWLTARVLTDRDTRTAEILDVKIPKVKFPNSTPDQEAQFSRIVEGQVPSWGYTISLDRLLTSLELAKKQGMAAAQLKTDPPNILFLPYPAVLIQFDGEPQLRPVENSDVTRAVNTPFLVLFEPGTKAYYLFEGEGWLTASDWNGPWLTATNPPASVVALTPKPDETDPEIDFEAAADTTPESDKAPTIIVATLPTELISSNGEPEYTPITANELLYMSNTNSDVLLEIASQQHYVLLSGRWFRAGSLEGPWTYVASDELPASFAKIPPDSEKGELLLFVAGTEQAEDAVMEAQIPQTSTVGRGPTDFKVTYDGNPKFNQIEGTDMYYATNTSYSVLRIDGKYYSAHEAVWYVADNPSGPWEVAISVPREQIDTIPPSNPHYNVKYVYIYDYTPSVVYVGYTPGYTCTYVYGPTVVWGTGWYYPGWYGPRVYYSYPATWGFHVRYNPWTGGWAFGLSYSTGAFRFSFGWGGGWYRPYYGGWWGPAGYRGYRHGYYRGYNRGYARGYARGYRNANIYNRNRNVARNARVGTRPATRPATRTPAGTAARRNNVYTDRNGDVYRRSGDNWQKRDKSGWSGSGSRSGSGLNRDYSARQRGTARTQSYRGRSGGGGRRRR
jgi:hypothetical protein